MESTIAERKRRSQETTKKPPSGGHYVSDKRNSDNSKKPDEGKGANSKDSNCRNSGTARHTLQSEASMQHVMVDSVKTRALLDHGAQVSIVCRELLPKVREAQGWTKEQCQTRDLKLDRQPVGANGTELGVIAV